MEPNRSANFFFLLKFWSRRWKKKSSYYARVGIGIAADLLAFGRKDLSLRLDCVEFLPFVEKCRIERAGRGAAFSREGMRCDERRDSLYSSESDSSTSIRDGHSALGTRKVIRRARPRGNIVACRRNSPIFVCFLFFVFVFCCGCGVRASTPHSTPISLRWHCRESIYLHPYYSPT